MEVIVVLIVENKIQNGDCIYGFQLIIPFTPFYCLFPYRKSGVIDASVLEKSLFPFLHLYQKFLTLFILTVNIENGTAVTFLSPQMLAIQIGNLLDVFFAMQ